MSPEWIKLWEYWNERARQEKRAGLWPSVQPEFRAVLYGDLLKGTPTAARATTAEAEA